MKTTHNSTAFIKSQLFVTQDGKTSYIHSADICSGILDLSDKDNAFNEAVSYLISIGWNATELEMDSVDGGCTQYFELN